MNQTDPVAGLVELLAQSQLREQHPPASGDEAYARLVMAQEALDVALADLADAVRWFEAGTAGRNTES